MTVEETRQALFGMTSHVAVFSVLVQRAFDSK